MPAGRPPRDLSDADILAEVCKLTTVAVRGATIEEILAALPISRRSLYTRLDVLARGGMIERLEPGKYAPTPPGLIEARKATK